MPNISSKVAINLEFVRQRVANACAAAGREASSVGVLAVSKTFGAEAVLAALRAGQRDFGENYLQEALPKIAALATIAQEPARWHFIGPVQSNKTRELAAHFHWVQSVDRLKIAQRLSAQRPPALGELNVCIQVNISGEASKSGCAPGEALALCRAVATLPNLKLRGLMAIPAPVAAAGDTRAPNSKLRALRQLFESIRADGVPLDTLSAGMSDDLEAAIAEGATLVRVGTAIFGARDPTRG